MSGYAGDLSVSQEKTLNIFKEMLASESTTSDERKYLRFLRARNFDASAAHKQYAATEEWRRNNNIDHILESKRPLDKDFKNIMSCDFHKCDKDGRPCYIERTGRTDIAALLKIPIEQIIRWHIWNNEKQVQRMTEYTKSKGHLVETMVHIHDMTGATMSLRKALGIFKKISRLDQDHYPERMGKIFIVNTPWVFPILWKLARVFLDAKTSKKCVVLKTSEIRKLCDYFNPEELPEEFGGTCSCEGGCLPPITKAMQEIIEEPSLTDQAIGAKKIFTYKVECEGKESLGWYFVVPSKSGIKFGIKFRPMPHSGWKDRINEVKEIWVEELEPLDTESDVHTGFYTPVCPGVCTLVWDNSASKWTSRTIKFHVVVSEVDSNSREDLTQT